MPEFVFCLALICVLKIIHVFCAPATMLNKNGLSISCGVSGGSAWLQRVQIVRVRPVVLLP